MCCSATDSEQSSAQLVIHIPVLHCVPYLLNNVEQCSEEQVSDSRSMVLFCPLKRKNSSEMFASAITSGIVEAKARSVSVRIVRANPRYEPCE